MKPRTFAKVESVYNIAQGKEEKPEPVREVARQQLAALDAGETTPHAAERPGGGGGCAMLRGHGRRARGAQRGRCAQPTT